MQLICGPMATISHPAFRTLIEKFGGCDEYYTEMINAGTLVTGGQFEKYYIDPAPVPQKLVWQLTGKNGELMEEAAKVLEPFRNLVVDTSSSFFWLKPEAARRLIRIYGSGRVMFGTDYPLWKQQPDLDYLEKLELTDQEYGNILWKNAVRVFRIDGYQSV